MSDITTAAMPEIAAAMVAYWTTPHIGVGDSTTAFVNSQTDLQAATNKTRKACTAFTANAGVITAQAQFGTGDANYAWNEVAVFKQAVGGVMYARKVVTGIGTKGSANAWTLELTITHTAG